MAKSIPSASADGYVQFAGELHTKCRRLSHIKGQQKLQRKILAEIKFLKNLLQKSSYVQESHLKSSNLSHFAAVVLAAENMASPQEILQPFSYREREGSLIVDVVGCGGHAWIKVIARKAQALHLVWAGHGQFGERSLLHQAEDYLKCARKNPHKFKAPHVYFVFYNNVTVPMAAALREKGVEVLGHEVPVAEDVAGKLCHLHEEDSCELDRDESAAGDHSSNSSQLRCELDTDHISGTYSAESPTQLAACYTAIPSPKQGKMTIPVSSHSSNVDGERFCRVQVEDKLKGINECGEIPGDVDVHNPSRKWGAQTEPSTASCPPQERTDNYSSSKTLEEKVALSETVLHDGGSDTTIRQSHNTSSEDVKKSLPHSQGAASHGKGAEDCSANYIMLMSELLGVIPDIASNITDNSDKIISSISRVNLDITALIALVSAVTHGHCNLVFVETILSLQAKEERESPVIPHMINFMKDKEIFACRSAVEDFKTILATLGGEGEKLRAHELLSQVTIVNDNPSEKALQLKNLGKVKDRSKVIFGTGDSLEAITMTANSGFLRAAQSQGVSFPAFLHAARALTEEKEQTAVKLQCEEGTTAEL